MTDAHRRPSGAAYRRTHAQLTPGANTRSCGRCLRHCLNRGGRILPVLGWVCEGCKR